jgi:hypothetical protein
VKKSEPAHANHASASHATFDAEHLLDEFQYQDKLDAETEDLETQFFKFDRFK